MCHFTSFQWNVWRCDSLKEHREAVLTLERYIQCVPCQRSQMAAPKCFSFRKKMFSLSNFLWREKKFKKWFQFKVNQLPSVEPQPPSSSSWRWPGTDLSDQRRGALPVWRQKGDTFFHFGSIRLYRIYSCERGQSVTCCAVLMAKNWCCPSAPHTYPNALLSVTSLAMKEILFTTCSCSITWVTSTSGFLISRPQHKSAELQSDATVMELTPDLSSMILMPDMEMLIQILCLCLPWDRAATAIPWCEINITYCAVFSIFSKKTRPLLWGHVYSKEVKWYSLNIFHEL